MYLCHEGEKRTTFPFQLELFPRTLKGQASNITSWLASLELKSWENAVKRIVWQN